MALGAPASPSPLAQIVRTKQGHVVMIFFGSDGTRSIVKMDRSVFGIFAESVVEVDLGVLNAVSISKISRPPNPSLN